MSCPSCGCTDAKKIDRKFLVTTLHRCSCCHLLFRLPTTTEAENRMFYQSDYKRGFTTDMPSLPELNQLLDRQFIGSEKDYSRYIEVLNALGCRPGNNLFDFGCSWGYGSWQMMQAGFKVKAFEISKPRATYARQNLHVETFTEIQELKNKKEMESYFDVFFSCHVLEHVPNIEEVFHFAFYLLKPGGLFVAFTPNGSESFRRIDPKMWHIFWGRIHPNLLDDVYYRTHFSNTPYLLASSPYDLEKIRSIDLQHNTRKCMNLDGSELLFVTKHM